MKRRNFLPVAAPLGFGAAVWAPSLAAADNSGRVINVLSHGAVGDGRADDTRSLHAAFGQLREGAVLVIPPGKYLVSEPIRVPPLGGFRITGGGATTSTLVASRPMHSLLHLEGAGDGSVFDHFGLDGNGLADTALRVLKGIYTKLDSLDIRNPKRIGIHCGMDGPQSSGYELMLSNSRVTGVRQRNAGEPASGIGVLVGGRWTDSHYCNLIIRGFADAGLQLESASNLIHQVHIYRAPAQSYAIGIRLLGRNSLLSQCYLDNFVDAGVEVLADNIVLDNCYFLRATSAFGDGPPRPGDGVRVGSAATGATNAVIRNSAFIGAQPKDPRFAKAGLTSVRIVNASAVTSAGHICRGCAVGETVTRGTLEIPAGATEISVRHGLIVTPTSVQLTPQGGFPESAYCVDTITSESFSVKLMRVGPRTLRFFWNAEA